MKRRISKRLTGYLVGAVLCCGLFGNVVGAAAPPAQNPQDGAAGLQGTVPTPPPDDAATITTPSNGVNFNRMPITINGLCASGLLIKIFANNVFVGSALCANGSYSLQVDLFDGRNDIVARIFDALDQPGPDSNVVTVTYNNQQFAGSGVPLLSLSSIYARRGANPGATLNWPIIITGGTPPYAVSVDWGDNKPASLQSEPFAGNVNISHVYDTAGTYVVVVKATDKNGMTAFLQLAGQANGAVTQANERAENEDGLVATKTAVIWVPAAISIPLILVAFWLGRRFELSVLRKHLEHPNDK
jgi:hypothetical protein